MQTREHLVEHLVEHLGARPELRALGNRPAKPEFNRIKRLIACVSCGTATWLNVTRARDRGRDTRATDQGEGPRVERPSLSGQATGGRPGRARAAGR